MKLHCDEGIYEETVSSQIVQRNKLWGEMAVKNIADLFDNKAVIPIEDNGTYEINQANYTIFSSNI